MSDDEERTELVPDEFKHFVAACKQQIGPSLSAAVLSVDMKSKIASAASDFMCPFAYGTSADGSVNYVDGLHLIFSEKLPKGRVLFVLNCEKKYPPKPRKSFLLPPKKKE